MPGGGPSPSFSLRVICVRSFSAGRRAAALLLLGLIPLTLAPLGGDLHAQQMPPAQVAIIPNASLVTAQVLKFSIWDATLLKVKGPQNLYSLVLVVTASENVGEEANLIKAGDQIEVFSRESLSPDLFGKTIQGTVRVRGDERGERYWIRDIRIKRECKR